MKIRGRILPIGLSMAIAMTVSGNARSQDSEFDPARELVSRLTLEDYKTTLKGLTQFGDRRQGTQRNRDAVDWIEQWLVDVGCSDVERLHYVYDPEPRPPRTRRPRPETEDLTTPTGGLVGLMSQPAPGRSVSKPGDERWTVAELASVFPSALGMDLPNPAPPRAD